MNRAGRLRHLISLLGPYRGRVLLMFVALFISTAAALAPPYLAGRAIDEGINQKDTTALTMIVIAFVAAAIVNWVTTYLQTYLINWVGQKALQDLRVELFEHLQRLSIGFYSRNRAGVLISRLTNDIQALDQLVTEGISTLFSATLTLVGTAVILVVLDANLALEQEPPWSVWRDNALVIAGEAYLLSGDVNRAVELFTESSALSAVNNNSDSLVLSESELALLAMDRGHWSEAAEHLERAQTTIDEHRLHDYVTCLLAFAAAARLAVHRGDSTTAERELTRAMRARVSLTFVLPWLSVRVRLQLAKVYWALGEQATAHHLLREIDDVMLQRPQLGILVEEVASLGETIRSSASIGSPGASPLSPAELRLLPYLQTHLTYREIAERLFVSRNTVSTEVSSIFRKFGVSSRGAAVEHALSIGLLGA